MIIGVGCDLVDTRRISKLYEEKGEAFISRILSKDEKEYFNNFSENEKQKISYLAKRFAGKEAVSKAFGSGIGKLSLTDISILNRKNGKPYVNLPKDFVHDQITKFEINISLSDEWPMAVAFVIISM